MKATREELIYIHKRIWNGVREYIKHSPHGEIVPTLHIKDCCIQNMENENVVSHQILKWIYRNSACVFCALYSADFCKNCPLNDCVNPESLYQQVLNGSEEACVKIRDLIYQADIPDYIEIEV